MFNGIFRFSANDLLYAMQDDDVKPMTKLEYESLLEVFRKWRNERDPPVLPENEEEE